MFVEIPQNPLIMAAGAFVLGWIVAKFAAYVGNRLSSARRDPRDDRIRSLEAELRIAKADADKRQLAADEFEKALAEVNGQLDDAGVHLEKQEQRILTLQEDLKDSVKKTRELRAELTERAEQNLKSEVKLREVETELSVAQASTDLLATGVLDYSLSADGDDDEPSPDPQVSQPQT